MRKIGLILSVLVFTAMTMSSASAAEESRKNPPRGMIEHDDRDGDGKVSKLTFLTLFFTPRSFSCTRFFSIPCIFLTGPRWVD